MKLTEDERKKDQDAVRMLDAKVVRAAMLLKN